MTCLSLIPSKNFDPLLSMPSSIRATAGLKYVHFIWNLRIFHHVWQLHFFLNSKSTGKPFTIRCSSASLPSSHRFCPWSSVTSVGISPVNKHRLGDWVTTVYSTRGSINFYCLHGSPFSVLRGVSISRRFPPSTEGFEELHMPWWMDSPLRVL